ncbi:hypothetical protein ED733_003591 [Metarhizium rileyi]|uniref:Uncharacterized protein n=1 Tax=Metarhizium rileyi (strain RCEF 4871) TaxID=1649241 RepID=A0A5C6G1N6_METRR|nr:hypothetical protein ED733_003591 [Metarhizium rileyi]
MSLRHSSCMATETRKLLSCHPEKTDLEALQSTQDGCMVSFRNRGCRQRWLSEQINFVTVINVLYEKTSLEPKPRFHTDNRASAAQMMLKYPFNGQGLTTARSENSSHPELAARGHGADHSLLIRLDSLAALGPTLFCTADDNTTAGPVMTTHRTPRMNHLHVLAVLLAALVSHVASRSSFITPPPPGPAGNYQDNPTHKEGQQLEFQWISNLKRINLGMLQEYPTPRDGNGTAYYQSLLGTVTPGRPGIRHSKVEADKAAYQRDRKKQVSAGPSV